MRALLALLLWAGCASQAPARRADATLFVECSVPSAGVYVDDAFVGRAAEIARRGVRVGAGVARVELRADGYFAAYREVTLAPGGQGRVTVELRAVPEGETAR